MLFRGEFLEGGDPTRKNSKIIRKEFEANSLEELEMLLSQRELFVFYYHCLYYNPQDVNALIEIPGRKPPRAFVDNKFLDGTGREIIRGSLGDDADDRFHKTISAILKEPAEKNPKLIILLQLARNAYNDVDYTMAHHCLWRLCQAAPALEPHFYFFMLLCRRLIFTPLTQKEMEYEMKYKELQRPGNELVKMCRKLMFSFDSESPKNVERRWSAPRKLDSWM